MSIPFVDSFSNPSKRYQQSGNFKDKEISSDDLVIPDIYVSKRRAGPF